MRVLVDGDPTVAADAAKILYFILTSLIYVNSSAPCRAQTDLIVVFEIIRLKLSEQRLKSENHLCEIKAIISKWYQWIEAHYSHTDTLEKMRLKPD